MSIFDPYDTSKNDAQLGNGGFSDAWNLNIPGAVTPGSFSADQQRKNERTNFQNAYASSGGATAVVNPDAFRTDWLDPYKSDARQNFWSSAARPTAQVDPRAIDQTQSNAALQGGQWWGNQQKGLAWQLAADSVGKGGPSPAQLAMQRQADASMRQQMAMSAGARGANVGAARLGAAQNAADISAQLNRDLGVQRAQEMLDAREQYGKLLEAGRGQDLQTSNMAYGQNADAARFGFDIDARNADLAMQDRGMDDAAFQAYMDNMFRAGQMGTQTDISYEGMRTGNHLQANGLANGAPQGKGWAEENAAWIGAAGTLGAAMVSDIRAKENIRPATQETDDTYRAIFGRGAPEAKMGDTSDVFRQLTPSRYSYRDPERYGAGEYVGPMAQQLEQTPAGRTVVSEDERGTKSVDAGRLSMMSAAEIGNLRRELDQVQARQEQQAAIVRGAPAAQYPTPQGQPPWAQPPPQQHSLLAADPYVASIYGAPSAAYPNPRPPRL